MRVPFFRDVLVESFSCPHCNYTNNSAKPAGSIQEKGAKYVLELTSADDLQRQVIKSDHGIFKIETVQLEVPKGQGQYTNVEGMLMRVRDGLAAEQAYRKEHQPALFEPLQKIVDKLTAILDGEAFPAVVSLDDPTGNSWISPSTHDLGTKYKRIDYPRTREQNVELGLVAEDAEEIEEAKNLSGSPEDLDILEKGVFSMPTSCPGCAKEGVTNIQKLNIPHFKEVYVWATVCEHCQYRSSEIKTGGEVPEKGKRVTLRVESREDLSRDILKADTCLVTCEELDLAAQPGTLGGKFTTIEGILTEIQEQLHGQIYSDGDYDLKPGDSMAEKEKETWDRFFARLDAAIKGELKFTMVLEDPMANSYIQNIFEPAPDPRLTVEDYTRSEEENEDLGLTDIKVEGYEQETADKPAQQ